jgi:uncharacterized protein
VSDDAWDRRLAGLGTEPLDGGLTLHVARTYGERRRGLAKMAPLPDDHGLRIVKCNSVHTFGMRFPLDLVWLGRRGRVLRVDHDVRPGRVKLCLRARSVVEACAGQGDRFADALSDQA